MKKYPAIVTRILSSAVLTLVALVSLGAGTVRAAEDVASPPNEIVSDGSLESVTSPDETFGAPTSATPRTTTETSTVNARHDRLLVFWNILQSTAILILFFIVLALQKTAKKK